MTSKPSLILGSSSPYRKELLERLHVKFTTDSPQVDETPLKEETPRDLSLRLSRLKARAVAQKHPGCVVIGSDQVLDLEGKCVGKPGNRENCIKQLEEMAGKTLIFHTAMTVIDASGLGHSAVVDTTIKMKELKRKTIEAYVDLEKPFNCAGSAKLEKLGICLISSFQSDDPTAIIGLGLIELTSMLEKCGIEVLPGLK